MSTAESTPTHHHDRHTQPAHPKPNKRLTMRWYLKRSAIGAVILTASVTGMAMLLHAGINPGIEAIHTPGTLLNTLSTLADKL